MGVRGGGRSCCEGTRPSTNHCAVARLPRRLRHDAGVRPGLPRRLRRDAGVRHGLPRRLRHDGRVRALHAPAIGRVLPAVRGVTPGTAPLSVGLTYISVPRWPSPQRHSDGRGPRAQRALDGLGARASAPRTSRRPCRDAGSGGGREDHVGSPFRGPPGIGLAADSEPSNARSGRIPARGTRSPPASRR
jgi:hypothetical protein